MSTSTSSITVRVPRLAWLIVLAAGVALFEALRHTLISTDNPNLVPALILLGAATVPVAFVTFVYGQRLAFDVPAIVIVIVGVVGGCVGVAVAGTLEYDTLHDLGVLPMIGVAVIEESAKLLVPLFVVLILRRFRSTPDGLLIGVAAGAGFAVLETMGYAFVALVSSKGNLAAVDGTLLIRGILSPAGHMAWTGLAAAALWPAVLHPSGTATARFLAAFAAAIAMHTAWDSIDRTWAYVVLAVLSLGLLGVIAHRLAAPTPVRQTAVHPAQPRTRSSRR